MLTEVRSVLSFVRPSIEYDGYAAFSDQADAIASRVAAPKCVRLKQHCIIHAAREIIHAAREPDSRARVVLSISDAQDP